MQLRCKAEEDCSGKQRSHGSSRVTGAEALRPHRFLACSRGQKDTLAKDCIYFMPFLSWTQRHSRDMGLSFRSTTGLCSCDHPEAVMQENQRLLQVDSPARRSNTLSRTTCPVVVFREPIVIRQFDISTDLSRSISLCLSLSSLVNFRFLFLSLSLPLSHSLSLSHPRHNYNCNTNCCLYNWFSFSEAR